MPPCNNPADASGKSEDASGTAFFQPGSPWDRAARYSAYFLILLAVLMGFGYVYSYGVNIYWGDDWDTLPILFEQHASSTLTIAKFWEFHNEHRIFFPKLAMFGLGLLTRGNALANMYLTELMLLAMLAAFIVAFRTRFTSGPAIWLMVPVAFLVFSFRQWENMLWGFQVTFTMVTAAALVAFLCLSRMKNERFATMFIGAVLSATVAAYSSLQGLLVWPIGLGQLLIAPLTKRRKIVLAALWTVAGVAEWLFYFIGYARPSHHPSIGFSWDYLLTTVGGALFDTPTAALVTGLLILILAAAAVAVVIIRRQWTEQSFWLAVIAYVLATLAATTIGRSGFGAGQALSSRYATFSILLVITTYVLSIPRRGEKLRLAGVFLAAATLSLAIFGVGTSFFTGLKMGRTVKKERLYGQTIVCTIGSQSNVARCYVYSHEFSHTSERILIDAVAAMEKLKYNVFADSEALKINPNYTEVCNNLGAALAKPGQIDQEIAHYRKVLEIRPDFAEVHNNLGIALAERGQFDEAVVQYRRALEIDPNQTIAHYNLGNALAERGQFDEAIAHYQKALEIQPDHAETHNNLGIALAERGRIDEAIAHFQKALEIKSDYAEAHNNLGNILAGRGRIDEAIAHYRTALQIQPGGENTHNNLGLALAGRGQIDEAIDHYQQALKINPYYVKAHNNLGNILAGRGQFDEAIAHYQKALEIQPGYTEAHNNLGIALAERGRIDEAIAHFQKGLKINPHDAAARRNLGVAVSKRERILKTLARRRESLRSNPNDVALLNDTAWLLATNPNASLRNGPQAVELAQRAVQLSGGRRPAILDTLAAAYAEAGRFPEAVETARKALELAGQQNKPALMESIRAKIQLYEAGTPFREK